MTPRRAVGLAGAVTLLCSGCVQNLPYEVVRYNQAGSAQVHLGCHDTYEVLDRPDAGSMLVATNVGNEAVSVICPEGVQALPLQERLRQAARVYFDETSKRPTCRITRERELSSYQTEYNYVCPVAETPPTAKPAARSKRRRPG